ncbi:hypothetical protein Peur_033172 [Populus x canadensis]
MGFLFVLVQKYWIFKIWAPIFISLEQIIDRREKDSGGGGSGGGRGGGGIGEEEEEEGDDRSGERFEVDLVCFFSAFITSTVADA